MNETAWRKFVDFIAEYLFIKDFGEILKKVNFIVVVCNGCTDTSLTEQEVVTLERPCKTLTKFFNVVAPIDS